MCCSATKPLPAQVTIAAGSISEAAKKAANAVKRKIQGEDDSPDGEDDEESIPSKMGQVSKEEDVCFRDGEIA